MSYTAKEVENFYYVAQHLEVQAREYLRAAALVNAMADKMSEGIVKPDAPETAGERQP